MSAPDNKMHVYVFRGPRRLLGFTCDAAAGNLPDEHGSWELLTRLNMSKEDASRPIVQTEECLDDIEMNGFHITLNDRGSPMPWMTIPITPLDHHPPNSMQ